MRLDANTLEIWIRQVGFKDEKSSLWDVYSVTNKFVMIDYAPHEVSIYLLYDPDRQGILWCAFNRRTRLWVEPNVWFIPMHMVDMDRLVPFWKRRLEREPAT